MVCGLWTWDLVHRVYRLRQVFSIWSSQKKVYNCTTPCHVLYRIPYAYALYGVQVLYTPNVATMHIQCLVASVYDCSPYSKCSARRIGELSSSSYIYIHTLYAICAYQYHPYATTSRQDASSFFRISYSEYLVQYPRTNLVQYYSTGYTNGTMNTSTVYRVCKLYMYCVISSIAQPNSWVGARCTRRTTKNHFFFETSEEVSSLSTLFYFLENGASSAAMDKNSNASSGLACCGRGGDSIFVSRKSRPCNCWTVSEHLLMLTSRLFSLS